MITPENHKEYHIMLSTLLRPPPFSTEDDENGDELNYIAGKELMAYHDEVIAPASEGGKLDWELEGEPFEEFREKWKEELEEAELYQSRHGDDFAAAAKAASGDE